MAKEDKKNVNNRNYLDPIKTTSQKRDEENLKNFKFGFKVSSGRLYFFTICLLLLFVAYLVLYYLQFFTNYIPLRDKQHLAKETNARIQRNVTVNAPRGKIVDANGKILAISIPYQTFGLDVKVFLDPANKAVNQEDSPLFLALAKALDLEPAKLYQDLQKRPNSRYFRLKSQVSPTLATYIKSLNIPGISSYTDFRRFYPYGDAISQIVGLLNNEGQGMFGIEKLANQQLTGVDGNISYEKDFQHNIINYKSIINSQNGHDVKLTINIDLQEMAYQTLSEAVRDNKADTATAVLIDVTNGEIIAMANAPSFNPNNRKTIIPQYLNNYAITSVFEPGSTVKPFVVYSGLLAKVITPTTVINTRSLRVANHQVKDVGPRDTLSIRGILQRSSNIGVAKISLMLPGDTLRETYLAAGFGQRTGLGLSGETMGYFPYQTRFTDLDKAVFSYGYMQQVTPLQLAHVYATLGNYGKEYPLSIISSEQTSQEGIQKLNPKIAKTVVELMQGVAETGGGGTKAAIPNYNVSVKTGTAKKVENGIYVDKYIAYTAGVAPSTRPRFALVIVIDNPKAGQYYGGAIAAPVWRKIMESTLQYYNIPEDNMTSDRLVLNHTP
ncbi:peptidoglycan D,D-transpeptidase FtsI family protein [Psittacicella gerlachiana]|uniref:Uncharacterized protein n=1 Tax=Psittacicella gerlachiana TaxID=2028574 RepID=A0A3A1YLJ2_9GAMM|nr:penicillin-binding transpeptidase domain-containing protein [Psittacicella gerlachiana]RIY37870.1 hypothetical protein CKF59_01300 [Psittacicella gerlachiana]